MLQSIITLKGENASKTNARALKMVTLYHGTNVKLTGMSTAIAIRDTIPQAKSCRSNALRTFAIAIVAMAVRPEKVLCAIRIRTIAANLLAILDVLHGMKTISE
jgi:hypothetical protein